MFEVTHAFDRFKFMAISQQVPMDEICGFLF